MHPSMAQRDFAQAFEALGLEGPSSSSETIVASAQVADVLTLGLSTSELEPRVARGVEFLLECVRSSFIGPALETSSSAALFELWAEVAGTVLRQIDAVAVLLYEGARRQGGDIAQRRLAHADRTVLNHTALQVESIEPELADELRAALGLIEAARARFDSCLECELVPQLAKSFHRSVLIWALFCQLAIVVSERLSDMVDNQVRPSLVADAIEGAAEGARLAASFVAAIAGLELSELVRPPPELREAQQDTAFVSFLLAATVEIPRVFGPEVRYALSLFRYPDEPEAAEIQVVIDAPADPELAADQLDDLCDGWWDQAVADMSHSVHAVLGVLDDD